MGRADGGRQTVARFRLGLLLLALLLPTPIYSDQTTAVTLQVTPPTIPRLPKVQRMPPPRQVAVLCSQQPVSSFSLLHLYC
uniref:Uncharacterized protein n=1 Tax=Rhinolophus ferrumequinum TaxID=59479 RepID=A0A671E436_RHIFE